LGKASVDERQCSLTDEKPGLFVHIRFLSWKPPQFIIRWRQEFIGNVTPTTPPLRKRNLREINHAIG
jgi:hypothetical protein